MPHSAEVLTFALSEVAETPEGVMTARLVPFGESVTYGSEQIRFEAGSLTAPSSVPLTIDHGASVRDRVGVMERLHETDDGAYAAFKFADTTTAADVRALLMSGAVTDVSVGVAEFTITDGVMAGTLDHVSIVDRGRFGRSNTPSKVLSVHSQEEPPMADETAAPEVASFDDSGATQRTRRAEGAAC